MKLIPLHFITDSPLPVTFNESEMNELANMISDVDIFENLEITNTTNSNDSVILETAHPSPICRYLILS